MAATVLRFNPLIVAAFLLLFCAIGCDDTGRANNLNEAIIAARKDPNQLVNVRAVIIERRPEKGAFAFYDAEEPDGRPFVVMTNEKLLLGRHYLLEGHMGKWPPGLHSDRELFFAEREHREWPWTLIGVASALLIGGLVAYRFKYKIRDLWAKKVKPEEPAEQPKPAKPTEYGRFELPTDLPIALPHKACLLLDPRSPSDAANQTSFDVSFPDDESELDFMEYNFGRSEEHGKNQYILKEPYIKRDQHFSLRSKSDKTMWIWINPEAGTRVDVRDTVGKVQATTTGLYYELLHGWTITVGKVKLHYSAPEDRR